MSEKLIQILNVCVAVFVLMYAAYVYTVTSSITLVTVVLLIAGLAPVLHMAWNYLKIKFNEYGKNHHYMKG